MSDTPSNSLAAGWDDQAERWTAWARHDPGDDSWRDSYWRFHRDALFALSPPPGRHTLDAGCGEGRVSRDLAAAGHRVTAIDRSVTLTRAAHTHPDNSTPVAAADAGTLPFADDEFDLVVSFMVLQDVDEPERVVAEAARVLEPGGRLHIATVHPVNSGGSFEPSDDHGAPFVLRGSYFERRRSAEVFERGGLPMTFHSEHRPLRFYTRLLAEHGFVIETLDEVEEPVAGDRWNRMPLFLHIVARLT